MDAVAKSPTRSSRKEAMRALRTRRRAEGKCLECETPICSGSESRCEKHLTKKRKPLVDRQPPPGSELTVYAQQAYQKEHCYQHERNLQTKVDDRQMLHRLGWTDADIDALRVGARGEPGDEGYAPSDFIFSSVPKTDKVG